MLYPNFTLRPLVVSNNSTSIERVSTYKILGVFIHSDVRWNSRVDCIYKKARKRLYSLRILRRAGVDQASMFKVYTSSVRSLLEYALPVWQSIPDYLSDKTESIQKRALKIVFPPADSYSDALELARMKTLAYRRDNICKEYMYKMKDLNHLFILFYQHAQKIPALTPKGTNQISGTFTGTLLPVERSALKTFSLFSLKTFFFFYKYF